MTLNNKESFMKKKLISIRMQDFRLYTIALTALILFSFASCNGFGSGGADGNNIYTAANYDQWKRAVDAIMSGGDNKTHTINITGDFIMPGTTVSTFGGLSGLTVTITGDKKISLDENSIGSLLRINSGQTVILQDVDLQGHIANKYPLVNLIGKAFIMRGSASVSGNARRGVFVTEGTFIMRDDASVHDNTVTGVNGAGVYIGGIFIMQDNASVHSNTATFIIDRNNRVVGAEGGGVFIASNAAAVMEGGSVYGNTAVSGGGAYIAGGGSTRIVGGSVYGNTADSNGGGVFIASRGSSLMEGGSVYGNTAKRNGGGVYIASGGTSNVDGGTIYGTDAEVDFKNTAEKGAAAYDDNQPTNREHIDFTIR
jgi:hypothetical protein